MRWFKHFSDTRRNPKVCAIERGLGEAGYARAIKLLEVVAQACGAGDKFKPRLDLRKAITNETWLAEELGVEVKTLEETLKNFSAVGFIDAKDFKRRVISIPQMLEYRDEWSSRGSRATHERLPSDSGLTPLRVRGKKSDSDSEEEVEKSHSSDSANVTRCASEVTDVFQYCGLIESKMAAAVSKKQWLRFEPRFRELFKTYPERESHPDGKCGQCTCSVADFLEDSMQLLKDEGIRWPKAVLARKKEIEEQARQ